MALCNKVAFINGKGGVGKTTSIFHVAGVLAARSEKILVVDLDKQRNTTDTFLANTEDSEKLLENTMFDFMNGMAKPEDVKRNAYFQTRGNATPRYFGVDVMPADLRFEFQELLQNVDIKDTFEQFIQKEKYTWVLVDMPPSNRMLNEICFSQMVDFVIVPFSSDFYSLKGYSDLIDTVTRARDKNANLNLLGIYLSRYTENCAVDKYIRDRMRMFGQLYMDLYIPVRIDIREAIMYGRPISFYKPNSPSNAAFKRLVDVMEQRINKFREERVGVLV